MIPSSCHKKTLPSILASKLKFTIPSPSSPDSLDFSDVFGPLTSTSVNPPSRLHPLHPFHPYRQVSLLVIRRLFTTDLTPAWVPCLAMAHFKEDMVSQSEVSDKEGGDEVGEERLGPRDFEILRVIGKGAFGKVFQMRKKGSPEISGDGDGIFAMKVMRKDRIISKNHMDYMKTERDILTKMVHPFSCA